MTWYLDADGDGWYIDSTFTCTSPGAGWVNTKPSGGFGDCDDSDASVYQVETWYLDVDNDGWYVDMCCNLVEVRVLVGELI